MYIMYISTRLLSKCYFVIVMIRLHVNNFFGAVMLVADRALCRLLFSEAAHMKTKSLLSHYVGTDQRLFMRDLIWLYNIRYLIATIHGTAV